MPREYRVFLAAGILTMLVGGCLAAVGILFAANGPDENVRYVRIVEDVSTGVRIELDEDSMAEQRLIVRKKECYVGDPTRNCVWIGAVPCEEQPIASEEAPAEE